MNRNVWLLFAGIVLLVAFALVGKDGAMSRVAGMDRDELGAAVERVAPTRQPGTWAGLPDPGGDEDEIVRPTVVDGSEPPAAEAMVEEPALDAEVEPETELPPDIAEGDDVPFDPRIG